MKLVSEIYINEERVGAIALDSGKFVLDPADSDLLRNIVKEPVFVPVGDKLEDVYADKDPVLFMEYLAAHYKSQGLRATKVVEQD